MGGVPIWGTSYFLVGLTALGSHLTLKKGYVTAAYEVMHALELLSRGLIYPLRIGQNLETSCLPPSSSNLLRVRTVPYPVGQS